MRLNKVIQRRIRDRLRGVDVVSDVNAVISANVNEPGSSTHASSKQTIVQRGGETEVTVDTDPRREAT